MLAFFTPLTSSPRIAAQNHSSESQLRAQKGAAFNHSAIPITMVKSRADRSGDNPCICLYVSVYVCICLFHLIPCILTSYLKLLLTVNLFAFSPGTSSRFHSTISIRCLDLISLFGTGVQETCLPPDVHVKCTPNLTPNWTPNLTAWLTSQVCLVSLLLAACYMWAPSTLVL